MSKNSIKTISTNKKVIIYILMITVALIFLLPFIIMVLGSIQDKQYFNGDPRTWWPKALTFKNFNTIFDQGLMGRWFLNSMIISVIPVATSAFIATLLGYIFAKKNFFGKQVIFWLFLSMIMIPSQVLVMPQYLMFAKFNWINTYKVFLIPGLWDIGAFFLLRQAMVSLPDSLLEAAKLDGCSEFKAFFKIVIPLSKQPIATVATLGFIENFNNLFYPLIFTSDEKMYPMSVGLATLLTQKADFGFQMAGAVLNFLPTLVIFICLQKYFTQGIAASGMK